MGTYIIIFGVFVLLILVLAFRTYPIEEIRDYRGKIVCVIYQKESISFWLLTKSLIEELIFQRLEMLRRTLIVG